VSPVKSRVPRVTSRARRAAAVVVAAVAMTGLAGCRAGFDAPTLQQYTQAEGINLDLADGQVVEQGRGLVKVRNLMVVTGADSAFLAGSIVASPSAEPYDVTNTTPVLDTLQSISGKALASDGTAGGSLTVALPRPVAVAVEQPVRLEDEGITVRGASLTPGVDAELTLTFKDNGKVTTRVPVIDGSKPDFVTLTPTASASATPGA